MIDVYVVEDQSKFREKIVAIIKNITMMEAYDMRFKLETKDPYEILEVCEGSQNTGIYFLDVDLGCDINGIQLAEKIRKYDPRGFIIFVTTHGEMSYLTFKYKVEALDYIIKDNFSDLGKRVYNCLSNINDKYQSANNNVHKTLTIKLPDMQFVVEYEKILFFETSSTPHKIKLHCTDRQMEFYAKLSDLEKELDERYIRCHRSFLVNKDNIRQINKQEKKIIMTNDQECYYSIRGAKLLKDLM